MLGFGSHIVRIGYCDYFVHMIQFEIRSDPNQEITLITGPGNRFGGCQELNRSLVILLVVVMD